MEPRLRRGDAAPGAAILAIEAIRSLVAAAAVAWLTADVREDVAAVLVVAVVLWVAFPVVLLLGSVVHEKVPVPLAAAHAGDWLVNLLLIVVVVGLWP